MISMEKSKVTQNYLYNTAYQILLVITPLITAPYIARVLGVESVSTVNYVYSIVTYFVLFGTVGSSLFGQREIAYYQDEPDSRASVFVKILLFRIVCIGTVTVIYLLTVASHGANRTVYLFMLFELLAAIADVSWYFQGMEDFKRTTIRNVIVKIVSIALIFILVKTKDDVEKYAVCFTLPTLVGNLSLWLRLPRSVFKAKVTLKDSFSYFRPILALFLPQIAIEVYTVLDKTMIGIFAPNFNDVGYYTYSQHIVKMILQIITSLGVVMLPTVSAAFVHNDGEKVRSLIGDSLKFVFMLGCPMMFGIAAVAEILVGWFYGPGYETVGPLIMYICPIVLLIGLSTVFGKLYLLPTKKQNSFTISVAVGAITNLVLNLVLIPFFGAVGASIATVAAEASVLITQLIFIRGDLPVKSYFASNIKYLLYGAIMFAVTYPLKFILSGIVATAVQLFVGIFTYVILLIITKDKTFYTALNTFRNKFAKKI